MTIKDLRTMSGMTQQEFANYFEIPKHTIENWEGGQRKCPEYLEKLIEYKLIKEGYALKLVEYLE
jgi:DNA-binding transcriptional regulator YiaG